MNPVTVTEGSGPIILSQPHSGTIVPYDILKNLNATGRQLLDTDWHIPILYQDLLENVTVVTANFSRYVIDANRDPKDQSLYPGQNTTGLVPNITFDSEPIWQQQPTEKDIAARLDIFHGPYHHALTTQINRIKALHGSVVLYDCHSIRSKIPFLFEDQLPDFNIGDNDGKSCRTDITEAVAKICTAHSGYRSVVNGRFKGGWTTRHYGKPSEKIFALQMELAQRCYLKSEKPPFHYDPIKAAELRKLLSDILNEVQRLVKTSD